MAGFTTSGEFNIYSPYQHVIVPAASHTMDPIVGIFDSINVYSNNADDDITVSIVTMDGSTHVVKISAGNTFYGPFTSVDITNATGATDVTVVVNERCAEWEYFEWNYNGEGLNSPTTGLGFYIGTPESFRVATYDQKVHDTDFCEMEVISNTGNAGAGFFTLDDAAITSINAAGQITFNNNDFDLPMVAKIRYRARK